MERSVGRSSSNNRGKVGSFCCPVPRALARKVQGILLPGSPGGRWNPLLLPGGVQPRFCPNNVWPLGRQLRGNRKSLIIVGTCVIEPLRWSHTDRQPGLYCTRRSYFAPISNGGNTRFFTAAGGGAGVLPPGSEMPIPPDTLPT